MDCALCAGTHKTRGVKGEGGRWGAVGRGNIGGWRRRGNGFGQEVWGCKGRGGREAASVTWVRKKYCKKACDSQSDGCREMKVALCCVSPESTRRMLTERALKARTATRNGGVYCSGFLVYSLHVRCGARCGVRTWDRFVALGTKLRSATLTHKRLSRYTYATNDM